MTTFWRVVRPVRGLARRPLPLPGFRVRTRDDTSSGRVTVAVTVPVLKPVAAGMAESGRSHPVYQSRRRRM